MVSDSKDAKMRYFLEHFKKKSLGSGIPVWVTTRATVDNGMYASNYLFSLDRLRVGRSTSDEKQKRTGTQRLPGRCTGVWISLSVLRLHTKYSSDVSEEKKKKYVQCNSFLSQFLYYKQQCKFNYKEASGRFRVGVIVNKSVEKM